MVPTGQKAAYLAAVVDGGALPPNFHTYLENALDKGGPWESREETRERLKIAKQQMLSEIIRAMDWVEDAVVLYDEQAARGLSNDKASHRFGQRQAESRASRSILIEPTCSRSSSPMPSSA